MAKYALLRMRANTPEPEPVTEVNIIPVSQRSEKIPLIWGWNDGDKQRLVFSCHRISRAVQSQR